ncbi:hypothetical protein KKA15_03005 [Patescibacteria group bacterium]|nr:hypothetical protein [Patescibacteria group bacterium]
MSYFLFLSKYGKDPRQFFTIVEVNRFVENATGCKLIIRRCEINKKAVDPNKIIDEALKE